MKVFISWSGPRSQAVAEALRKWLPMIINAAEPFLSSSDVDKGARWGSEIAIKLQSAKSGIICLTPSNIHSDWILFEAGALSKHIENTFVCTFLLGLEPSDVKFPLAQFQATRAVKKEVLHLLKTLNKSCGDTALAESHIEEAFEVWWPRLDSVLNSLPPDEESVMAQRSERDLLEEILALLRNQARSETLTKSDIQNLLRLVGETIQNYGEVGTSRAAIVGDFCGRGSPYSSSNIEDAVTSLVGYGLVTERTIAGENTLLWSHRPGNSAKFASAIGEWEITHRW